MKRIKFFYTLIISDDQIKTFLANLRQTFGDLSSLINAKHRIHDDDLKALNANTHQIQYPRIMGVLRWLNLLGVK